MHKTIIGEVKLNYSKENFSKNIDKNKCDHFYLHVCWKRIHIHTEDATKEDLHNLWTIGSKYKSQKKIHSNDTKKTRPHGIQHTWVVYGFNRDSIYDVITE